MGALFPLSALWAPLPREEQGRGNAEMIYELGKPSASYFLSSPLLFGGEVSAQLTERGSHFTPLFSLSRISPSWA
jgi:hypothetical protein